MKLILMTMALFTMVTGAAFSLGTTTSPTLSATRVDSSSIYIVNYSDLMPGKVTLTIWDEQGNLRAKRIIQNQNGFSMPLNFSSVEEGKYKVQTENGTGKQDVGIDYNNDTAPTYTRVVALGDSRYLFTSSHVGKETITVKIYDGNDALVYNEYHEVDGLFSIIFNLKDISGKPSFDVTEDAGHSLMIPGNLVITDVGAAVN